MIELTIQCPGLNAAAAIHGRAPEEFEQMLEAGMLEVAEACRGDVVDTIDDMGLTVMGNLQSGCMAGVRHHAHDIMGVVSWEGPAKVYAAPVNYGTKPHTPPMAPLKRWAYLRFGDESIGIRVWQTIRKKGTKGKHFVAYALARFRGVPEVILSARVKAFLRRYGRH